MTAIVEMRERILSLPDSVGATTLLRMQALGHGYAAMISMKHRGLLLPILLLGACEPARLVTSPAPADHDSRIVQLAPGEYLLGHRSTAADLVRTLSLTEMRRRLDDTLDVTGTANTRNASRAVGPEHPRLNALIGGTVSSFAGFQNFATETNRWWPVVGDSAYYRDLSIAAVQSIDLPHDGDTWSIQVTLPDGSIFDFPTVVFHSSWNGAFNCFVVTGGGQSACGVTGIDLYSTRQVQCGQTGKWTFRMSLNGVQYEERTITVVAKVNEQYVPLMAQGNPAWGSQLYAHSCTVEKMVNGKLKRVGYDCPDEDPLHDSIHGKGCAITSAAMVMGYHGAVDANSSTINTWLRDNDGYQEGGATDFDYVRHSTRHWREWTSRTSSTPPLEGVKP